MKIGQLLKIKGVFTPFIRMRLPPRLSYKLLKFIKAIEFEEEFFNTKFRELLQDCGKKDENGKFVLDNNGNIVLEKSDEFKKAIEELNNIEVTVPDISFTLDELQNLTLSVLDIAIIEDFIKEDANG
ncbi:hypothetical protein [Anaerocaecibacter muris]|uniref:hypothetical protein n=1 Tax=Anaerocaecibacter muris TaxID=2941513 RepID=UPI00203BFDC9|nr:hypothetical protein [Anaerocaecibacter muris]